MNGSRLAGSEKPRYALSLGARRRAARQEEGLESRAALYITPAARYFIHRDLSISSAFPPLEPSPVDFQLGMRSSRDLDNVSIPLLPLLLVPATGSEVPRKNFSNALASCRGLLISRSSASDYRGIAERDERGAGEDERGSPFVSGISDSLRFMFRKYCMETRRTRSPHDGPGVSRGLEGSYDYLFNGVCILFRLIPFSSFFPSQTSVAPVAIIISPLRLSIRSS